MWLFDKIRRHGSSSNTLPDENRPIKLIKTGYNTWQIVYADAKEN
ncbi:MAG: hypothetical protein ACP5HW_03035 [Candidatus Micrarchaeia archaeon]